MNGTTTSRAAVERPGTTIAERIKVLVGSGGRIGKLLLPFLIVGLALNLARPSWFSVGGPSEALRMLSVVMLIPGITIWAWSVLLILTRVPRHELITGGPFALVKHPLYTDVALLVLPWVGFLLDTWLGVLVGAVLYVGCRMYAPMEEQALAETFGPAWDAYADTVKVPWL